MVEVLENTEGEHGEWVSLPYASSRTGYSTPRLVKLIEAGDMPAIKIRNAKRTSRRVPRRLIDEVYALVMAGGQVELVEFARDWAARNALPEAVAQMSRKPTLTSPAEAVA